MPVLIVSSYNCELGWHMNEKDYWARCKQRIAESRNNNDPIAHVRFVGADSFLADAEKMIITSTATEPVISLSQGSLFDSPELERWIKSHQDNIYLIGCFNFNVLLKSMLDARSNEINLISPYEYVRLNTAGTIPQRQIVELCSAIPAYRSMSIPPNNSSRCRKKEREANFRTALQFSIKIRRLRQSMQVTQINDNCTRAELDEALGVAEVASLRWLTAAGLAANKIPPLLMTVNTEDD